MWAWLIWANLVWSCGDSLWLRRSPGLGLADARVSGGRAEHGATLLGLHRGGAWGGQVQLQEEDVFGLSTGEGHQSCHTLAHAQTHTPTRYLK